MESASFRKQLLAYLATAVAFTPAAFYLSGFFGPGPGVAMAAPVPSAGALTRLDRDGNPTPEACPLKHTSVRVEISGSIARVTVTQDFENPYTDKIEAVYTFPLPARAAVDDMTMSVGDRTIRGVIKRREEARQIYEQARRQGHVAGLLDQERPNIFTQAVANIAPGAKVQVVISYVETLSYEEGSYEFSFPMVVGPRYIPGTPAGKQGGGWAPDTDRVPDASRITPPVTPPGTRAGHDISLEVKLDAGVPIDGLRSPSHEVAIERPGSRQALVKLARQAEIPNKDFLLRYDVAGREVRDGVLLHRGSKGGYFALILQPPERVTVEDVTPKELVFVLDTSGSMHGFPMEKARETMKLALNGLYPRDTFNLITFAGDTHILFPEPVPASPENLAKAQQFLDSRRAGGGTEMMKAIEAALAPSAHSGERVRVVCFMTDGYVGNDMEIVAAVKRNASARVFSFGIGSSVNRFLLDKMAEAGRGEVEYVGLQDDGSAAARRFHERVRNPLWTDITVDWAGLPVRDVYPTRIPDLFSAKPVILNGRYDGPARGTIRIKGRMSGREVVREVRLNLPASQSEHDVLATLWARQRIDHLMAQDWKGIGQGTPEGDLKEQITRLGLEYRLMTQFTSFVAVEERMVVEGGEPRRVEVPVEMPQGVSYEGVFGGERRDAAMAGGAMVGQFDASRLQSAPRRIRELTATEGLASPPLLAPKAPEPQQSADQATSKLHPDLRNLVAKEPGSIKPPYVKNGTATVEVWLTDTSQEALRQLKALGFEETGPAKVARIRIGRIALAKLEALAKLAFVSHVAPHQSTRR